MNEPTIKVTGKGSVKAIADVIFIDIDLVGKFMKYSEAYFRGKQECWMVKDIVSKHGLDSSIVSTLDMKIAKQVSLEYDKYTNTNEEVLTGYTLKNLLRIVLPKEYGHLDSIIGDISRIIEGVEVKLRYGIADPRPYRLQVLSKAVEESRVKAETLAAAAGYKLAGVNEILYTESDADFMDHSELEAGDAEDMAGLISNQKTADEPILITDKVTVSWFLKK